MRRVIQLAVAIGLSASVANAQPLREGVGQQAQGRAQGRGQAPVPPARRAVMDSIRRQLFRVVQNQLALNPVQMNRLRGIDTRFENQRRMLMRDEADARQTLRRLMTDSGNIDQARVAAQLDTVLLLKKRRLELTEAEQKELATFLSPIQRAKYFAIQERLQREIAGVRN
jgi:Spy/CpxP family protein refolding chaperone